MQDKHHHMSLSLRKILHFRVSGLVKNTVRLHNSTLHTRDTSRVTFSTTVKCE